MIHQIAEDQLLLPEVFYCISIVDASTKKIVIVSDKNLYKRLFLELSIL